MENANLIVVLAFASVLTVFVLAGVQLMKRTVNVKKNLLPVLGLGIGLIVGGISFPFTDLNLTLRLWAGGLAGLSATGLFELGKNRPGNTKD
ncbi:holin [Paenibacillus zeisoli]|uniref:Holin n=1 Tax=Paenibacillus zeisoli TaxID=2496267 RepID=A0A433XQT0_9BACL|nr:holin [Paenibacillus zeisoli]RUT36328.1 holin [Paenibacillus zeisoli]